jgi:hypothetical protein
MALVTPITFRSFFRYPLACRSRARARRYFTPWSATRAHIAMPLIVAIIVKSGIVVDFADFAIFDPISDDGEWYSPGMCSRRDCLAFFANRRSPLVCRAVSFRHVLRAGVAGCGWRPHRTWRIARNAAVAATSSRAGPMIDFNIPLPLTTPSRSA